MVSVYDYLIIGLFLAFMAVTGWIFKRLNPGATDYFAGGFRMTWWLLGASSFISNMSCWSFTGAANMAWKYGMLIFGFYFADVLSYAISFLWFAPRFRQLRLVTAMDAVRPGATRWFQLYWSSSRDLVASLVARAERSGCEAIVVTLDTHVLGWRPRDLALGYLPFSRGLGIAQYTSDPVFRELVRERAARGGRPAAETAAAADEQE